MENWGDVRIRREFSDGGVTCYRLVGGSLANEYAICSEAGTRRLMASPEVAGFGMYRSLLAPTSRMIRHLKENGRIGRVNVLSILRGSLGYPIEEACCLEHVPVHAVSFISSERVFEGGALSGLDVKYEKIAAVPDASLVIGDIVASGETLAKCLRRVLEFYRGRGEKLRNVIVFDIGGFQGIEVMEGLTREIREYWPDFEGFVTVFYEGVFSCYAPGSKDIFGAVRPTFTDLYWKNGIVAPEFRRHVLSARESLFEKCTIYDGGARRFEISAHMKDVFDYWNEILRRADRIDKRLMLEEKLGHSTEISYEDWLADTHYGLLDSEETVWLFRQEKGYIDGIRDVSLREIAEARIRRFTSALGEYTVG